MKKGLLFAALAAMFLVSCEEDEDENDNGNNNQANTYLRIDGQELRLNPNAEVIEYGDNGNGVYNFDLVMFTEGISVINDDSISGNGYYVYFEMWTSNENALENGTYNLDLQAGQVANNITVGIIAEVIDGGEGDQTLYIDGSLDLSGSSNDAKTVTGSITSMANEEAEFRFTGNFRYQ